MLNGKQVALSELLKAKLTLLLAWLRLIVFKT